MPHLFSCDVTECFETCEVYADSEELKGILIVSDESDHRHAFYNYFVSLKESLVTDGWLIHEDPSTKTFWNFMLGKDYAQFGMDGTAPSDPAAACDLSCGRSGISASWTGRDDDAGSDRSGGRAWHDDLFRDAQSEECRIL